MKNGVNSRPWASGCRAMPEISALPATPSPMPAPIAPPAMINPPPMSAPAAIVASIHILLDNWCWTCGLVMLLKLHRLAEVKNRQQRKNERLDGPDEEVETLPDRVGQPHDPPGEQRDQRDQDRTGENVAEKSEGQRDRLGNLLDEVDRRQECDVALEHRER